MWKSKFSEGCVINPIDDLLGEIEKFKTNVVNSNGLMNLLNKTTKKIGDQETKLTENHNKIIEEIHLSIEVINQHIITSAKSTEGKFINLEEKVTLLETGNQKFMKTFFLW